MGHLAYLPYVLDEEGKPPHGFHDLLNQWEYVPVRGIWKCRQSILVVTETRSITLAFSGQVQRVLKLNSDVQ